ncbi:methylated-DNA--[protein]-cysteine S-methyltransferase [bacterium]|nr:methylated-DNA--[protein]-cysteine S-methyltransferase [bacterium]
MRNLLLKVDFIKFNTPFIFDFTVFCSESGVIAGCFSDNSEEVLQFYRLVHQPGAAGGKLDSAAQQLSEYFQGDRKEFDLPLDYTLMVSDYQRKVLQAVLTIPYGCTASYGEVARRVNSGPRAVGGANARNPIPVIIPCHRVIGSDGKLVGYGGSLHIKEALLRLEGAYPA